MVDESIPFFPQILEIEPIHTCNLRCKMCHVSTEVLTHEMLDVGKLLSSLDGYTGGWVYLGSTHEPMAHPEFSKLVHGLTEFGAKLIITTNGTLAKKNVLTTLKEAELSRLYISFDGVTKNTYEAVRRGGEFYKALSSAEKLISICEGGGTITSINYTLMASTLDEAHSAVDFWEEFGVDGIGYILAVQRANNEECKNEVLSNNVNNVVSRMEAIAQDVIAGRRIWVSSPVYTEEWFRKKYGSYIKGNVVFSNKYMNKPFNAKQEYLNKPYPGMPIPCSAPFRGARILYNGDVLLCNRFKIGNIYHEKFSAIWRGINAQKLRKKVLQDNNSLCSSCDYYKFCISSSMINIRIPENYMEQKILNKHKKM